MLSHQHLTGSQPVGVISVLFSIVMSRTSPSRASAVAEAHGMKAIPPQQSTLMTLLRMTMSFVRSETSLLHQMPERGSLWIEPIAIPSSVTPGLPPG